MLPESPESENLYRSWSNCGLGSTVTTEDRREIAPGLTMISSTSLTLAALDADGATVDMVVRNRVVGGPTEFPPTEVLQEIRIPAVQPPPAPEEFAGGSESNADAGWEMRETNCVSTSASPEAPAVKKGEELLVIAGREIACRWIERTAEAGPRRMTLKVWLSDQIPGGQARSEVRIDGEASGALTTIVVSFLKS